MTTHAFRSDSLPRCTTVIKLSWWEASTNLSFSLTLIDNFFMRPNYSSLHKNLILVSKFKWRLQKIIQVLGTFLFTQFACRLTKWLKWPDQGTTGRTRGLQTEQPFSIMQGFWQRSEAVGLLQVSKMLRQRTGQISAQYSSSKIKKYPFTSFSSGPRTTYCTYIWNNGVGSSFSVGFCHFFRGFFVQDNSGHIETIKRFTSIFWQSV